MSKLENKKRQKKESLFSAAFDLFTSKGFSKTSISDIVERAGMAKGTFYLYFKDKYDIQNQLIAYKAAEVCNKAYNALEQQHLQTYEDRILSFTDQAIRQLQEDTNLLRFISKNLSWGILKNAIQDEACRREFNIEEVYQGIRDMKGYDFSNSDVMFYMIMELVSATCYNSILENNPVSMEELKPHLYAAIRAIIQSQLIACEKKETDGTT